MYMTRTIFGAQGALLKSCHITLCLQVGSISLKYSGALQAGKVSTSQQFSISHSRKICGQNIREAYIPSYATAVAGHEVRGKGIVPQHLLAWPNKYH